MILATLAACTLGVMYETDAIVTAYTPSIEGGGAGTGLTSLGYRTDDRPYGIATDPSIIPYGSVIHVPGYRESVAKGGPFHLVDDTGATMRAAGRKGIVHIDVRMRTVSSAKAWGVRRLKITVYTPDP